MKILILILFLSGVKSFAQNPTELDSSFQEMLSAGESIFLYLQPYNYDTESRRDPFQKYKAPSESVDAVPDEVEASVPTSEILLSLQRYPLARLKLVAIMWDIQAPKVLVKDPTGKVHVLERNDRLGERGGYVAAIRENEMVVVQSSLSNDGQKKYEAKVITLK